MRVIQLHLEFVVLRDHVSDLFGTGSGYIEAQLEQLVSQLIILHHILFQDFLDFQPLALFVLHEKFLAV
jgi:hypothetical protein